MWTDQGLSFDSEPADKEPKNQNWLFWSMKYYEFILAFQSQGCRNVYRHTDWSGQSFGKFIVEMQLARGWFEPWPRTSWQGAKEPELAILKYEMILSFQSIWLILGKYDHLWFWVTGIWAPTFLVKVVTHKVYFSGVTAFSSLSADLRSRLKPPSVTAQYWFTSIFRAILKIYYTCYIINIWLKGFYSLMILQNYF